MIKVCCAVWDSAAQVYGQPIFVPTVAVAARSFIDECGRVADDNPLSKHPEDFELRVLGEYDDSTGLLIPSPEGPRLLIRAKEVRSV